METSEVHTFHFLIPIKGPFGEKQQKLHIGRVKENMQVSQMGDSQQVFEKKSLIFLILLLSDIGTISAGCYWQLILAAWHYSEVCKTPARTFPQQVDNLHVVYKAKQATASFIV